MGKPLKTLASFLWDDGDPVVLATEWLEQKTNGLGDNMGIGSNVQNQQSDTNPQEAASPGSDMRFLPLRSG